MSDQPILDREHLARYTLGEPALEAEVLGLFMQQLPISLAALDAEAALERHRAAHTIKGSARAIGASRLAAAAESAERIVEDDAGWKAAVSDIRMAADAVGAEIEAQ